jgi:8-oxo-dGTP pyrophosphatase MutT (NUDIX family)
LSPSKNQIVQLKELIMEALMLEEKNSGAAGIAVVKKFDNEWKILGLKSAKPKHNGMFDLTKGMIDSGESPFEAAVRETYEESGIPPKDLNFEWGRVSKPCAKVTVYIASTKSEPFITANPKTGNIEHTEAKWMTIDEFEDQCIGYLRPVAVWVRDIVNKSSTKN